MTGEMLPEGAASIRKRLGKRSITLIGLMGAGKTTVGRRLAAHLALPFRDTDAEIETAARMTIPEIFELYGEAEFRALETRVVSRLAGEGGQVIATGGGAYMSEQTRDLLKDTAITIWLKADLETLMTRVAKRTNRPLLKTNDPRGIMSRLMDQRYPVYAGADITIATRAAKRDVIAAKIAEALEAHLKTDP